MDLSTLEKKAERASIKDKMSEVRDTKAKYGEFLMHAQAYGELFTSSYRNLMDGFGRIFERVGYEDTADSRKSNPITVGHYEDASVGSGRIQAHLVARLHGDNSKEYSNVSTHFCFVDNAGNKRPIASERFWTVSSALGGGLDFLDADYGWDSGEAEATWYELGEMMDETAATQELLMKVLDNPESHDPAELRLSI